MKVVIFGAGRRGLRLARHLIKEKKEVTFTVHAERGKTVYLAGDFNGDGKAEVALKTAPATTKRNSKGRVDSGEEYLSVLNIST